MIDKKLKKLPISKKKMCLILIKQEGRCDITIPVAYCLRCFLMSMEEHRSSGCTPRIAYDCAIRYMAKYYKEDLVEVLI